LPTLAEDRFDELIGSLAIREPQLGGVPFQLALDSNGDRSQDKPFGVRPGNAEIRASRRAPFASANPVAAMRGVIAAGARAGRARQERLGQLVFGPSLAGQQADALAAATGSQVAFGADENAVVAAALVG